MEVSSPRHSPCMHRLIGNPGSHAGGRLAFQEFMIVPCCAPTFTEAMRQGAEVYQKLKTLTKKRYGQSAGNVGDEGGVAPDIQTAEEALDLITDSIEAAGYTGQIKIAMDVASSEFYREGKYDLDFKVCLQNSMSEFLIFFLTSSRTRTPTRASG